MKHRKHALKQHPIKSNTNITLISVTSCIHFMNFLFTFVFIIHKPTYTSAYNKNKQIFSVRFYKNNKKNLLRWKQYDANHFHRIFFPLHLLFIHSLPIFALFPCFSLLSFHSAFCSPSIWYLSILSGMLDPISFLPRLNMLRLSVVWHQYSNECQNIKAIISLLENRLSRFDDISLLAPFLFIISSTYKICRFFPNPISNWIHSCATTK